MVLAAVILALTCKACEERAGRPFGFPFAHRAAQAGEMPRAPQPPVVQAPPKPLAADDAMPVVRPKLIRRNAPQYPPLALRDGVEGWVTLKFQLSPEGVPFNQAVHQSSDLVFDQASLRAVAGCRYEPAPKGSNLYGGRWFYIRYRFLVEGSPLPPNGQLPDTSDGPLAN